MLFRESGKNWNATVRFIRTFYCAETKSARQKTLGKIKKSEVGNFISIDKLFAEFKKNEATCGEIKELGEWLEVMKEQQQKEYHQQRKDTFLSLLKSCSTIDDEVIILLTKNDQHLLFEYIKKLEDRLREKNIKRTRKPRK